MKTTSTFSADWLKAIAHLSRNMQDRIIADVTRWQLTGEMPEKMSAMRRALFYSIILQIDPAAIDHIKEAEDTEKAANTDTSADSDDTATLGDPAPKTAIPATAPDYCAIDSLGHIMPAFPSAAGAPTLTRAQRRRLCKALV